MSNIGSDHSSPKEFQSVFTIIDQLRKSEKKGAYLLELRTETGLVYVRPSGWQRIRLRRTFRYFHVLPPQLLSRRDQRLIARLLESAVATPALPVERNAVFGVVEKVRPTTPAAATVAAPEVAANTEPAMAQAVTVMTQASTVTQALTVKPVVPALPPPEAQKEIPETTWLARDLELSDPALRPWIISAAAAAACIALIMGSVYGVARFSGPGEMVAPPVRQVANDTAAKAPQPPANRPLELSPAMVSPATPATRKHRFINTGAGTLPVQHETNLAANQAASPVRFRPAPVANVELASETFPQADRSVPSAGSEPRLVSEFPQGHFAHPFLSEPNVVGEVRLKALIGTDGSVKQVTVVSGSPRLARAGMRAVRQWHYRPYEVNGKPVEVETEVKISFFGPDAVSIASIADRPASLLR